MIGRILLAGIALAGAVSAISSDAFGRARSVEEAKAAAPSLELRQREPETFTLSNGMKVYFLESHRLPLVTVRAVVRAGAIWEPADRPSVAELTGRVLRRGGTVGRPADELDEELDFLAARLTAMVGDDQGNLTLNVLTENLEPALAIFADVLRNPAFAEEKVEIQKNLMKESIRRENDHPISLAIREYGKLIWGEDHPRGRAPTEEDVERLTRDDLRVYHDAFFAPSNVLIGVAGDVSRDVIRDRLESVLGDWEDREVEFPPMPAAPEPRARVAFAQKGIPQTTILIGHLGPRETDPRRAAGEVMMSILGSGGFKSYIMDRVRVDEGLAYAAGGFLQFGPLDRGMFITYALTGNETSCRAADLVLEQIHRIRREEVSEEDLVRARDGILNSEAFEYDSNEEIVANLMRLVYYGLPEDHDRKVIEAIGRVTPEDVREAAEALLDPDRLTYFAVGNPETMDCSWEKYAEASGVEPERIELD
jgi:predicted Zn-dependent peptidase